MSGIGFVMEKLRHGSELTSGEMKVVADELERLVGKLEACAQEVAHRDEAAENARKADRDRAERLRLSEEEGERLRDALAHAKRQRITENTAHEEKVNELEGMLRDIHYGLLYQPDHTRAELANVITTLVTPHPAPLRR